MLALSSACCPSTDNTNDKNAPRYTLQIEQQ